MDEGAKIRTVMANALHDVIVVAPYIKKGTLSLLFESLRGGADRVICVTRWLPQDIASGVCDLEILDVMTAIPNGMLLLQPQLHAKYYRGDDRCLVGSANLTHRGLGWTTPSNKELLLEIPRDYPGLQEWELHLLSSSIPASPDIREQIAQKQRSCVQITSPYIFMK